MHHSDSELLSAATGPSEGRGKLYTVPSETVWKPTGGKPPESLLKVRGIVELAFLTRLSSILENSSLLW